MPEVNEYTVELAIRPRHRISEIQISNAVEGLNSTASRFKGASLSVQNVPTQQIKALGQIDAITPDGALALAKLAFLAALNIRNPFDVEWVGFGAVPYDPAGVTDDPVVTSV